MHHIVRSSSILATVLGLSALAGAPAHAGSYTVYGECNVWQPANGPVGGLVTYPTCPMLTVRNVVRRASTTPAATQAAWILQSPPGAAIEAAKLSGTMIGTRGWQSAIYSQGGTANGVALVRCPGASCPGGVRNFDRRHVGGMYADALIARVRCDARAGCSNGAVGGGIKIWASQVTIADSSAPVVSADGPLAASGWKSGTLPVAVTASDNVGIKQSRVLLDGVPKAAAGRQCDYAAKVPCPNGTDTLNVPLTGLADGTHRLTVEAVDSADNTNAAEQTISVDNTPPVAPVSAAIAGGAGWRSENHWAISWKNPPQAFAPISAVEYELCPATVDSADPIVATEGRARCLSGSRSGTGLEAIGDLTVPAPGNWTMRLWLVDEAGNRNSEAAAVLAGVGFDPTPPTGMSFADEARNDPARLQVRAGDDVSGLASGAIEVRRHGTDAWRPLPTELTTTGLTAIIDDERFRKGLYHLRATAVNGSGLQQSTSLRSDGRPATLRLPVRTRARLLAGRLMRHCNPRGKRCGIKVIRRLTSRPDRRTAIEGQLIAGGKPVAHQDLEVWRRLAMPSAGWTRAGTARTGRSGRFAYVAPPGPAARIRFRYPGTSVIRGVNAVVTRRVPARTSMRVSRRNVVNGEYVTFGGRVKGGWIPPEGTLVELQVYTRRRWRTFAQPRASAQTRRWEFPYRFETIRGKVAFRFRARIRRQSNYPFHTGRSRSVRVRVQGL